MAEKFGIDAPCPLELAGLGLSVQAKFVVKSVADIWPVTAIKAAARQLLADCATRRACASLLPGCAHGAGIDKRPAVMGAITGH